MKRRDFMLYSGAAGLTAAGLSSDVAAAEPDRDIFELCKYILDTPAQRDGFGQFMAQAAVPAYNRLGIKHVGVFYTADDTAAWVLLRHPSAESAISLTGKLFNDEVFLSEGAEFLNAAAEAPAYKRIESSLLTALEGMPRMAQPIDRTNPDRVFQLRIYESPSLKTNLKKIEMFNRAELDIFRKTGLTPVFFAQALIGPARPNLTYMLAFDNAEEQKKAWNAFRIHPDWLALKALPEYADKRIISGITNIQLRPAEASQL